VDEAQFTEWWQAVQPQVRTVLNRYGIWLGPTADVEQEVALLAWARREDFANFEHFRAWARRRAIWLALDRLRANPVARRALARLENAVPGEAVPAQESVVALREVMDVLAHLPGKQRRVLEGLFTGKTDAELAQELEIDASTVRSLRRFGRARLHLILSKEEGGR
jgi:RNA polymerase sigma factor (sigma-70 family)